MTLDDNWFSEAFDSEGVAFSLRLTDKLHDEQTPWQRIQVWQTSHWGRLLTLDGCVMVTDRDNFIYHEMLTHPALFSHGDPRRVLIIGGGDCGTLREVLKHPGVESAVMVDIDERVIRVSEQYFPDLTQSNGDPRAELRFEDGLAYVRDAAAETFDVVLIDSTDPVGFAEGLFGAPFLADIHRILCPGGIVAQQSESPLLHGDTLIRRLHDSLREAGFTSRALLPFPLPSYPSGWWSATLAGKGTNVAEFREVAAQKREFETRYYNEGVHRGALQLPEFLRGLKD
ncbi:MAG: polyamine aminopropyltransferase [Ectothiorhodospiraceae bacterium]|jgi:spermidine synthase